MNLEELKKVGLTQGEIKLYSTLIDLGESTRKELVKKSGISPSKIYDVANRLIEKGIISSIKKDGLTHFSAANPQRIKDYVENKKQEIEKERELIDDMLPELISRYNKTEEQTDVEVFYGWEGMKTAYDDIIDSMGKDDVNYVFGASQGFDSEQANRFYNQYHIKKKKKGYATKIIFNEDVRENKERMKLLNEYPNEIRFLYNNTFTEINLYKHKVLIIFLLKKPMVIRIKNQEAANSFKTFFDSLWKYAKK